MAQELVGKIFISYVDADKDSALEIRQKLISSGYTPWTNEDILPGEEKQYAIEKAMDEADFFVVVLSRNSVNKTGMIQKEIRMALNKMEELVPGDLFIIPARLDDCEIPERIKKYQALDWNDRRGSEKLLASIRYGLDERNEESIGEEQGEISSTFNKTSLSYQTQSPIGTKNISPKENNMPISGKKATVKKYIAYILAIITAIVTLVEFGHIISDICCSPTISYQVIVYAEDTNQPIRNAEVFLEIEGGVTPKNELTDSKGVARFILERSISRTTVKLTITAKGYQPYQELTFVNLKELPNIVLLKTEEP